MICHQHPIPLWTLAKGPRKGCGFLCGTISTPHCILMYLRSPVGHLTRYKELFHKLAGPGSDGVHPGDYRHGQYWLQGRSAGPGIWNEHSVPQQETQVRFRVNLRWTEQNLHHHCLECAWMYDSPFFIRLPTLSSRKWDWWSRKGLWYYYDYLEMWLWLVFIKKFHQKEILTHL